MKREMHLGPSGFYEDVGGARSPARRASPPNPLANTFPSTALLHDNITVDRFVVNRQYLNMERSSYILGASDESSSAISLEKPTPLAYNSGNEESMDSYSSQEYQERLSQTFFEVPWRELCSPRSPPPPDAFQSLQTYDNSLPKSTPAHTRVLDVRNPLVKPSSVIMCFGKSLHALHGANRFFASPTNPHRLKPTCVNVRDAPGVLNDYCLNLMAWNSNNILAVALGIDVYLLDVTTNGITKVHDNLYRRMLHQYAYHSLC